MTYNKEDLLNIWSEVTSIFSVENTNIKYLSTSSIRDSAAIRCPVCKELSMRGLSRINGRWACPKCNNTHVGSRWRAALAYRVTNDLIEYFGEVNSKVIFDSDLMDGFVEFAQLRKSSSEYILFLQFLQRIISKEMGGLQILGFLDKAKNDAKRLANAGK